jgi:molybdenum cofactor guanylyltransferase
MISQEHKKHTELVKPTQGNFGRNEWAILGTPCPVIKILAEEIIRNLSADYKCAYVDAAHAKENEAAPLPGRLASGAFAEYADKINHHEFAFRQSFNSFQFRKLFSDADFILVNGNHQEAKSQVVVIDKVKDTSLRKKLKRLTDVQLFLLADGEEIIFDFVKEAVPHWEKIPVCRLNEKEKIISFFREKMKLLTPKLNGLVLAGGKSLRLGTDKGKINWHGKEQRYYLTEALQSFCEEVFISCREEQQSEIKSGFKTLTDTFIGLGPYGAILSAFREQPNAAWFVVACDLPLLDKSTMRFLVEHRNLSSMGTTFESPYDGLPEPLITIWEPKSYPLLLSFLSQGYSCPRKALINSDSTVIKAPNAEALMNVNTQAEFQKVKEILQRIEKDVKAMSR